MPQKIFLPICLLLVVVVVSGCTPSPPSHADRAYGKLELFFNDEDNLCLTPKMQNVFLKDYPNFKTQFIKHLIVADISHLDNQKAPDTGAIWISQSIEPSIILNDGETICMNEDKKDFSQITRHSFAKNNDYIATIHGTSDDGHHYVIFSQNFHYDINGKITLLDTPMP